MTMVADVGGFPTFTCFHRRDTNGSSQPMVADFFPCSLARPPGRGRNCPVPGESPAISCIDQQQVLPALVVGLPTACVSFGRYPPARPTAGDGTDRAGESRTGF